MTACSNQKSERQVVPDVNRQSFRHRDFTGARGDMSALKTVAEFMDIVAYDDGFGWQGKSELQLYGVLLGRTYAFISGCH